MDTRDSSIDGGPSQPLLHDSQKAGPEVSMPVHPAMTYRPPPPPADDHVRDAELVGEPQKLPVNPIVVVGRGGALLFSFIGMIIQAAGGPSAGAPVGLLVMTVLTLVYSGIVLAHHLFLRHNRRKPLSLPKLHLPEVSVICCGWKLYICGTPEDDYDSPKKLSAPSLTDLVDVLFAFLLLLTCLISPASQRWHWYRQRNWYQSYGGILVTTCITVGFLLATCILRRFKFSCSCERFPDDEDLYEYRIQLPPDTRTMKAAGKQPGPVVA